MKFIHLTDPHLTLPGHTVYGLDPLQRFKQAVQSINQSHADADFCVITGDLAHTGDLEAYQSLKQVLSELIPPCHLVMGNHDERINLTRVFDEVVTDGNSFVQSVIDSNEGKFLILDSVQNNTHQGAYCTQRLGWLRQQLEQYQDQPVYLFMHHPPFKVHIEAMDHIGINENDAYELSELLLSYGNVKHIFFGHVHRPINGNWQGVSFSTLRGTNHQVWLDFTPGDIIPGSHEPPAYAIVYMEKNQIVVHNHDFLDVSPKFDLGSWRWDDWHKVDASAELV